MYFRRFLNPWLPALKTGEKKIIGSLVEKLPPQTAALIYSQVEKINLVKRNPEGPEICFYSIRGWKPFWNPMERIPTSEVETKLGRVEFRLNNSPDVNSAEMWLVNGHLFSMELSCSPEAIADKRKIDVLSAEVFLSGN